MKIYLNSLGPSVPLSTNAGTEIAVYGNNGKHRGNIRIGRKWLEWEPTRAGKGNGYYMTWEQFAEVMKQRGQSFRANGTGE